MKLLSTLSAILILFQSLNISLGELSRLDEFLEHASFHKEQYGDNLFVFISKHYGELKAEHEKNHQEEQGDHEKLPFQQQCCTHHAANAYVLFSSAQDKQKVDTEPEKGEAFYYLQTDYSGFRSGIFQPPKKA
ncbi:hypothetical protein SAMN06265375_101755 [Muriicola jejuensis]|uniref:Uncharacterized protein n=1 Tax=Muriicola jejuensis TaxID=504488 RepID=A0A6P0UCU9_9FLAO|nr:hypothetical protein [Muriicola jejuensis]NER09729.1 hypothetical protein [Muriicola jejuensis]SMP06247.1 hypothetical protein SAMN06265375_101755 [Muriicola jejuensis]